MTNFSRKLLNWILSSLLLCSAVWAQSGYPVSAGGPGLQVFVGPGSNFITGTIVIWGGGFVQLPPNSINYVFVDGGTGLPNQNQTGFPANCVPLRTVITGVSTIISSIDSTVNYVGAGSSATNVTGTPTQLITTTSGSTVQVGLANPTFFPGNAIFPQNITVGTNTGVLPNIGLTPDPFCPYYYGAGSNVVQICNLNGQLVANFSGLGGANWPFMLYKFNANVQNGEGLAWNATNSDFEVTTSPLCTIATCGKTATSSKSTNNFVIATQAPLSIGTNNPPYSAAYISNGAGPPAWTTAGRKGGQGVYFGAAGKTGHGDIVQVSCGGTNTTFRNIGGIGVPTTSPNTGSCPGTGLTVSDGNITWLQVGASSVNNNNQSGVVDDFWNDIFAIHDASGNVLTCTFNAVMPYIGWNVIDIGITAPSFNFTSLDAALTAAVNDPNFCPGSKLALNLIPFSGSSANGGQNLPPYVVTQAWATTAANATQWTANHVYPWDYTISVPGGVTGCGTPCYEQVTSTGANASFTSGSTQPTWTTGAPPQTTADGSGTWTSFSTAPAQKFTYCDGSGSTGIAWSLSGISNTLKSNLTVNGTTTIVATPAITAADAVTGILWLGDTSYDYALRTLYKNTTQHYNQPQWAGLWAYIRGGLTKDGQNLPICGGIWAGAGTAANANTGVSNANWNNLWVAASEQPVGYMGTLQTAGYSIQTSPQSNSNPSNATDPPALADGLSSFIATGGANGAATGVGLSWGGEQEALDATALTQGTTFNGDWARNTAQWYHAVPNVSIQMVTDSGGGAGCNTNGVGTLPQNVTFASQFGIRMYEVLQPDYYRLDPVSPDFALCSQGSLSALTAFQNGQNFIQPQFPLFFGAAGPTVSSAGLVNWNPPVQKSFLTAAFTNATTNFTGGSTTSVTLSPGIFAAALAQLHITCKGIWQNTGAAATSAPKFQWTGPSSPTTVSATAEVWNTATAENPAVATAFSSSMDDAAAITAQTNFPFSLEIDVINGTTAGQIQLQAALHAASGSLTLQPGLTCQTN